LVQTSPKSRWYVKKKKPLQDCYNVDQFPPKDILGLAAFGKDFNSFSSEQDRFHTLVSDCLAMADLSGAGVRWQHSSFPAVIV